MDLTFALSALIVSGSDTISKIADSMTSVSYFDEANRSQIKVPTGTTDMALPFGGVTSADLLIIVSDKAVSIKLSGGAETIAITPPDSSESGCFVSMGGHSAVTISNSSGDEATVDYFMADLG